MGVPIATIGLNLSSSLLEEAFTLLLGELNHEVTTAHADEADLIICDLYSVGLERLAPPKLPTLVLVPNNDSDIIRVLRSGHHGYLRPNAGRQQLAKAIETLLRNDHWVERTLLSPMSS